MSGPFAVLALRNRTASSGTDDKLLHRGLRLGLGFGGLYGLWFGGIVSNSFFGACIGMTVAGIADHLRTPFTWGRAIGMVAAALISLHFLGFMGTTHSPNEAYQATSEPSRIGSFSGAQLREIAADPNLRIAHSMGHLDDAKLATYRRTKDAYEKDGHKIDGTFEYTLLLMMVPTKDWFQAAHNRGLTSNEFYQTTNLLFSMTSADKGYDPLNKEMHNNLLFGMTGKHLEDY